MSITFISAGAGVSSQTTGISLSPAFPATVDANKIAIAHVFWEGIVDAPSTPSGWTLLHGPEVIETTVARHWVYGKITDGTEDGATVTFATTPVSVNQRAARIYLFDGYVSGTITDVVRGFAATSHATDPQMPSVTTTVANSLAVALVAQNDNNAFVSPTGETGGDWVEAVAEYTAALTPGLSIGLETAAMASIGTISGGSIATTNDPCGVIAFEIRTNTPPATVFSVDPGSYSVAGVAASLEIGRAVLAVSGVYTIDGSIASLEASREVAAGPGAYAIDGVAAALTRGQIMVAAPGDIVVDGNPATLLVAGRKLSGDPGAYAIGGTPADLLHDRALGAGSGAYLVDGDDAALRRGRIVVADPGSIAITGVAANFQISYQLDAEEGGYAIDGTPAKATLSVDQFPGGIVRKVIVYDKV